MRYIKLYEDFQMGDLNFMYPEEIQDLFMQECKKQTPDINLIRVILDNGLVDVNDEDEWGYSPLHRADNVALAELLISAGADVSVKDKLGSRSPLHWATDMNNVALAEYLISVGADVDAKDKWGRSPLDYAFLRDNKEMQALLKKHGAVE